MSETMSQAAPPRPEVNRLDMGDLRAALAAGWQDFRRAAGLDLVLALPFVLGGLFMLWQVAVTGGHWWVVVLALGFPLFGPFAAAAYYDVSRHLERGERPSLGSAVRLMIGESRRQVPSMAMVLILVLMFWVFIAHLIFALFLGVSTLTNITSSLDVLLSARGLSMLAVGTAVGAVLSFVVFASTVTGLPAIVDQDVDVITAMITSWQVVLNNPGPMLAWGLLVAVILGLAMLPAFLGLFIALPLLGHGTWWLYHRAVSWR